MKKLFMLVIALATLLTALPVNAAKETAQVEQVIHATYAIYLSTQFKASTPGIGSNTLGIEVFDYCTGKKVVYWQKPLPERLGAYSDNLKTIYGNLANAKFWGTVLYLEFDDEGTVIKTTIHERFRSWSGTDYSSDPKE
jgi:hypothetical protein